MMNEPQNQDWSFVEHALEEGTCSGFKMAILESEKIFQQMVKNCHFKRPVVIKELPKILSEPEKFFHARLIAEKIILEPNFEITREDAKNIIAAYWRGVQDFGDWLEGVGWLEKQFLKIKYYFPKKAFAKAGIFLFLLILFIQLANKTQVGGNAIAFIADWNDFLFWKIIIAVGVCAILYFGLKIPKVYLGK